MINFFKKFTLIVDFFILILFLYYVSMFYFAFETNFISIIFIIYSIFALSIKLLYWHLIRNLSKNAKNSIQFNLNFTRFVLCIVLYIIPPYYITQHKNLVVNSNIIITTLILIIILITLGMMFERLKINKFHE